jgi:hypothetical protein
MREIMQDALAGMSPVFHDRGITVETRLPDGIPPSTPISTA